MRVVLDTNVVISALIWGGKPSMLFQAAVDGDLLFYTSPALLEELSEVLARSYMTTRLDRRRLSVEQAVALYANLAQILDPPALPVLVSRDPDDDAVLALAVAAEASVIVTGDGDLLVLGAYAGIPIVTASHAVVMLESL